MISPLHKIVAADFLFFFIPAISIFATFFLRTTIYCGLTSKLQMNNRQISAYFAILWQIMAYFIVF